MPPYSLRPATADDRDFLWGLLSTTMRDYVGAIWGWDEAWQIDRFNSTFRPAAWTIVTVAGVDAGAFEHELRPTELYLAKLYILPEFQRRGFGSSIVTMLMDRAVGAGVPLTLTVLRSNVDAKRLYQRLGLVVVDETPERTSMTTRPTERSPHTVT